MGSSRRYNWWESAPVPYRSSYGGYGGNIGSYDGYNNRWLGGAYNYRSSRPHSYGPYRRYDYDYYDEYDEPAFGRLNDDSYDWYGQFGRYSMTQSNYDRPYILPYNNRPILPYNNRPLMVPYNDDTPMIYRSRS